MFFGIAFLLFLTLVSMTLAQRIFLLFFVPPFLLLVTAMLTNTAILLATTVSLFNLFLVAQMPMSITKKQYYIGQGGYTLFWTLLFAVKLFAN